MFDQKVLGLHEDRDAARTAAPGSTLSLHLPTQVAFTEPEGTS